MYFDGASTQASVGVEYEALLLGVKDAKKMGIMCMKIFGDVDLIIQQVNNTFQEKNVRLKAYRDEVWKLRDSFMFFEL